MRRRRPKTDLKRSRAEAKRPAFTLIELLVVVVILGILITFILTAATGGIRLAEQRATQALITKLEVGMADRVDALISTRADANQAHSYLSTSFISPGPPPILIPSNQRAQIIARFDQIKAELPDVFIVQSDPYYPLNFGAAPFPLSAGSAAGSAFATKYYQYLLPFGSGMLDAPGAATPSFGASGAVAVPTSTGIFGASYTASAGIYKNLVAAAVAAGAAPAAPLNAGYDGVDNNDNGLIDEMLENGPSVTAGINTLLLKHTHKTARSEMLYALLVEGQGPYGSVFNREEFTDREVRDTDGDGLPEFVDAWGEPLQFYRWPIFFQSDSQKGASLYNLSTVLLPSGAVVSTETRQQNPLDPSQKLLDPVWWSGAAATVGKASFAGNLGAIYCGSKPPLSDSAFAFQMLYTGLTDPNSAVAGSAGLNWDKGSVWAGRRAYYSKYLIVSGGPDKIPGVPVFDKSYYAALISNYGVTIPAGSPSFSGLSPVTVATQLDPSLDPNAANAANLRIEDQAAVGTFFRADWIYYTFKYPSGSYYYGQSLAPPDFLNEAIIDARKDDVTNHNLQAPGGATQ